MTVSVSMPHLGASVVEGTVTRWLKAEGDRVETDEPLVEVSTDKVDTEILSPASGVLVSIKVAEDQTVCVGVELAVIGDGATGITDPSGNAPPGVSEESVASPSASEPQLVLVSKQKAPPAAYDDEELRIYTPLVRKLARDFGVDLKSIVGTGVGGRVRQYDVLAANQTMASIDSAQPGDQPPARIGHAEDRTEKLSRLRRVIATRMVESLQTSAQLTSVIEVDVTNIARLRDKVRADFEHREGVKLTFLPFFAMATIEALKAHPLLNSSVNLQEKTVTYHHGVHLGIAVDSPGGLMVPVVRRADDLNIAALARNIADLADRTRTKHISADELTGSTFTLTNTGSRGALFDTPIINLPEVAILGTGAVVKRAVVRVDPDHGESIAVRAMVYLALSYDHRIVDGADAARFLNTIKSRLETGSFEHGVVMI
jgi:pyruvate dehydrogenase E2 component (dihydrolipoamide acetyltransferase)